MNDTNRKVPVVLCFLAAPFHHESWKRCTADSQSSFFGSELAMGAELSSSAGAAAQFPIWQLNANGLCWRALREPGEDQSTSPAARSFAASQGSGMYRQMTLLRYTFLPPVDPLGVSSMQMARELGLNPKKIGKLDNHDQEPWKLPKGRHLDVVWGRQAPIRFILPA
jgi:hypothetical protein